MIRASIIIPVRNGGRFITAAIDSALAQAPVELEVIVVDDASDDDTAEVIRRTYGGREDGRVRYERNPDRLERSRSRNRGADLARGEFVLFLDADDEWAPGFIDGVIDVFERERCDMVCGIARSSIDEAGNIIRVSQKRVSGDIGRLIAAARIGNTPGMAWRRSAFPGFNESLTPHAREDWEILLRSWLTGLNIAIYDSDKVRVRKHGGRTSRSETFVETTLDVYRHYRDDVPKAYRPWFLCHVGETCMRYGRLGAGWGLFVRAIAERPAILLDRGVVTGLLKRGFRFDRALAASGRKT